MFDHIFVPLDGSKEAERVVGIAEGLAATFGARVTLFAVVEAPEQAEDPTLFKRRLDEAGDAFKKYLEGIHRRLKEAGIRSSLAVVSGRPADEIVRGARDRRARLIVMLSRRDANLARGILGSVTDRVMRESTVPLLVAHPEMEIPERRWAVKHILAPLDLSQLSSKAVPVGIALARAFNADLRFLRVTPQVLYPALAAGSPYAANVYMGGALREEALKSLQVTIDDARREGVNASGEAATGSPAAVIIKVAEGLPDCLVVMSTHGLGGFQRMVLGSVTDKVVRGTGRPVLVIPPSEK
jgi:nucleotide-binding universal stress UspA family protein